MGESPLIRMLFFLRVITLLFLSMFARRVVLGGGCSLIFIC